MEEAGVHGALCRYSGMEPLQPLLSWRLRVWQRNIVSEELSCPPKLCESPPGCLDQGFKIKPGWGLTATSESPREGYHDNRVTCSGSMTAGVTRRFFFADTALRLHFLELSASTLSKPIMAAITPFSSLQVMGVLGCFTNATFPTCLRRRQCVFSAHFRTGWEEKQGKTPSLQLCLGMASWNSV